MRHRFHVSAKCAKATRLQTNLFLMKCKCMIIMMVHVACCSMIYINLYHFVSSVRFLWFGAHLTAISATHPDPRTMWELLKRLSVMRTKIRIRHVSETWASKGHIAAVTLCDVLDAIQPRFM